MKQYTIYTQLLSNPVSFQLSKLSYHGCRHFDKDRSGKLEHQEFKSCLRSLGYDIALMEGGETDPEFEAILDQVDPNRYAIIIGKCVFAKRRKI